MKRTILQVTLVAISVLVLILSMGAGAAAAGNGASNGGSGEGAVSGLDNRLGQNTSAEQGQYRECGSTVKGIILPAELKDSEISWLTYMREEEKLARDVYLTLYNKYQSRIFKNIATSEQTHMDAVKTLLDRYGIQDPAAGNGPGEFTNRDLQALYTELINKGSISLNEAFKVGVEIEETDIGDLKEAIAASTPKDIVKVYTNLLQASLNHLQAFTLNAAK
jgi:hypothetical protein